MSITNNPNAKSDFLEVKSPFFRKIDWAAFWTATIVSFVVYFFTAAPSVTLEDCGELAVAGDYLGVPHPPGYPLWTICAWIFSRALSFVTFRGQPNPSWAIAVMSGFFGALAAGITAMLITRTSSDMLRKMAERDAAECGEVDAKADDAGKSLLARGDTVGFAAGVAGSLIFAFSPVMWSQSTIVEVYSLNAFFLMWIFLLTYRWMHRPSDRILWLTAFIFGLGLTNYQVLLLMAVPLVVVICLKNTALFRDFVLVTIPFLLTMGVMKLGAMPCMKGFAKPMPDALAQEYPDLAFPPYVNPAWYIAICILLAAVVVACGYFGWKDSRFDSSQRRAADNGAGRWAILGALLFLLLCFVMLVPQAQLPAGMEKSKDAFSWLMPVAVFVVMIGGMWLLAWFAPGGKWYATAVTAVEFALGILLMKGALAGLTHPQSGWFWFYVALNFVLLALAWILLANGKRIAITFLCAEAGVAFYGYMPISSETNPPMNWGYPRTWAGFKHALMRGQYEKIDPVTLDKVLSTTFVRQIGSYFTDLRTQFTLLLAPLGFLPFAAMQFRKGERKIRVFGIAAILAAVTVLLAIGDRLLNPEEAGDFGTFYKYPMLVVLMLSVIGFMMILIDETWRIFHLVRSNGGSGRRRDVSESIVSVITMIGIFSVVAFCVIAAANIAAETLLEHRYGILQPSFPDMTTPQARLAMRHYVARSYPLTALIALLLAGAIAALEFLNRYRKVKLDVRFDETSRQWMIATLSCFMMMSLFLILLAQPKGDLQDMFIQKVKFIASHGIFAIWIGYGMAFALATLSRWFKSLRVPQAVLAVPMIAVFLTPLVPVYENYTNGDLIMQLSSADADHRDYGWQFGNYQLRGAEAIREELEPDEEPLPNPDYPDCMTTNAVFFGGTDPGRFVPTYMIFSAKVRPDVYLITQNALADPTYMDTMRDMYGDHIWMPTPKDNSDAFSRYIDEVQRGIKPNMGDISYSGGRVQVTGALAVMEINGYLTEAIFLHNRDLHDFYLEESYTLRWMYPYLTPHGLIMKINHDKATLSRKVVTDDMDFWDWYTRRFLADRNFRRDIPGQKSFSKLRGAIAGLYSYNGRLDLAERAFREARALYPVSPEANLRLLQEVLLARGRFGECVDILAELIEKDPNNSRFPDLYNQIKETRDVNDRLTTLISKFNMTNDLTVEEALEAGECFIKTGRTGNAAQFLIAALGSKPLLPAQSLHAAQIMNDAGQPAEAAKMLKKIPAAEANRLLQSDQNLLFFAQVYANGKELPLAYTYLNMYLRKPNNSSDYKAWLDMASIQMAMRQNEKAAASLMNALQLGRENAFVLVEKSPQLQALYNAIVSEMQRNRATGAPSIPGGK